MLVLPIVPLGLLRSVFVAAALALQLAMSGCGDCDDSGVVPTYVVHVHDAKTGDPLCGSTVLLDGSPAQQIGSCMYTFPIPYHQPSVTIRAEHPGYQSAEKQVPTKWPSDSCGKAEPARVNFALERL